MSAMRNNKRNSLPSLTMNKFFVNKRASMFEKPEEPSAREKREWSPCGLVETSQRKLEARKEKQKKEEMKSRRKRQADPYAEESSDGGGEDLPASGTAKGAKNESKACCHANRAVNISLVRKAIKGGPPIGQCIQCRKQRNKVKVQTPTEEGYDPVIWLCLFCGHQGCDRNTQEQHSLLHYRTPRSDPHCLILNTQAWNVWCYDCDSEVHQTSTKKLHEIVEYIKRQKDMAPNRSTAVQPNINKVSNGNGGDWHPVSSTKSTAPIVEDNSKATKKQQNTQASILASLPKVKGLSNLGNTCFFNSVMQSLAQTHFLTQLLDVQCQSGQRMYLPGNLETEDLDELDEDLENGHIQKKKKKKQPKNDEDVELNPLDLILPEGGALTLATAAFLKDMHSVGKNGTLNPGHLFGQLHGLDSSICKKSAQFQGYEQQDSHELLRCLLDAMRNEEILRAKRAILKAFALSEKTDPNTVNPRLKTMIKGYGKQATHTIVDHIFGGHLISTVFCEECHGSSQVFEPLMDLSLPISELKGRPKKSTPSDEESVLDCFGRQSGNTLSKHQVKKMKRVEKKNRKTKGKAKGGSLAPACIRANQEDEDESSKKVKNVTMQRRMTEKRRLDDAEDMMKNEEDRLAGEGKKKEEERLASEGKKKTNGVLRGESFKFKQLMAARRNNRPEKSGSEESSEDSEYDLEDDDDDNEFADGKKSEKNVDIVGGTKNGMGENGGRTGNMNVNETISKEGSKDTEEENISEEEDDDSEEEDSEEEDSEETDDEETRDNGSDGESSKKKNSSTEISDADIEDNTDSEHAKFKHHDTRQPSIVVENFGVEERNNEAIANHRCLKTCYSSDQLNYNSASDTSERYYTPNERDCNGLDTGDDVENFQDLGYPVDQSHMEEMCLKVKELKIKRKSSSKESLLDTHNLKQKRGSTETLHTFKEKIIEDEEDESKRKTKKMKKLKQEWIAQSLRTLAPRYQCQSQECSIMSCLTNFTAPELLMGNNKITCENCTRNHNLLHPEDQQQSVKSNASKQLLILSPPAVLTLHLKRFHHMGFNLTKVNRYVHFPLVLDIAPFTSSISMGLGNMSQSQSKVLYGLYSVVEHSGRLNSGHYVAYVRSRPLDPERTSRHFLNLKPASQFEIDHLVSEMAGKIESSSGWLPGDMKGTTPNTNSINVEELEEEVKAGRWFHVSDTYVAEVNIERVMKAQAYLLFYERLV